MSDQNILNAAELRTALANRVTVVCLIGNIILSALKLTAGLIGNSSAMLADAMHSLSDTVTDVVVLAGMYFTKKPVDKDHSYGHGKYETMAAFFVALFLGAAGVYVCAGALKSLSFLVSGGTIERPGYIALVMAVVSVLVKELMFRYTEKAGKKINSNAIIANAWHHRSDAFSSVATTFGIGGAILLGPRWLFLDPLTAFIVSFFIFKVAYGILKISIGELLEESAGAEAEKEITAIFYSVKGVVNMHKLKTRKVGFRLAIDAHVLITRKTSFVKVHAITEEIEEKIKRRFGGETFICIHSEPV